MAEKVLPLEERSISQIYLESQDVITYVIPVYQRNYAWQDVEITALVKDVHDSFLKDETVPYYIGTLVTYKRGDNQYEVIDGQQRLTTIFLILKAIGGLVLRNKLTYSARAASASTLGNLDNYPDLGTDVDGGIREGFKFARKALDDIVSDTEQADFKKYFLHQVRIIQYNVPKDVDLNHYFEVMNSRGEQLEKHEIVKSILCECIKDEKDISKFSAIWDACGEMDLYIQQLVSVKSAFSDDLQSFVKKSFDDIPEQGGSEDKKPSIRNLLNLPVDKQEDSAAEEKSDRFQPIIDFPNFLLIILRIAVSGYDGITPADVTLDDKELLREFKKFIKTLDSEEEKKAFAKDFAFKLLKGKYYLDNYIVHHISENKEISGENPWKLQRYFMDDSKKKYPRRLGSTHQDELVHLLSMFEVSFTPRQHKNYLFYCLMFLFEKDEPAEKDYLEFLRGLADKYFYDVYLNPDFLNERKQPRPNAFDSAVLPEGKMCLEKIRDEGADYKTRFVEIYRQGKSDIPLFVFNYTDYILWRKYADTLRSKETKKGDGIREKFFEELGCTDFELDSFKHFYFSRTRRSLEHYYPQAMAGMPGNPSQDDINCFGNFAMIGAEANSSGSSLPPEAKLFRYSGGESDPVSVASLKFKIMMQKCQDNRQIRPRGEEWNADDMREHQEKMLAILIKDNLGTVL
jgi:hypothetical protein